MREDLSNPKYIRVEVKTGPTIRGVIRIESGRSDSRNRDSMGIIDLDKTIETIIFEGTLDNMEDRIIEESIEVIGAMNITESEIGQEKGHSQEIMVTIGIEVPVKVDQGQDLELVLTGIG